jgi:hypothetical protein
MNYAQLQAAIASYMHRDDLTAIIPTFISLGEARVYRDLRVPEMHAEIVLNTTDGVVQLPDGYLDMRDISYNPGSTGSVALTSVGRHGIARVRGRNGKPIVYSILGNSMEIRPADDDADFTLQYWVTPAPLSLVDNNPTVDRYPYLFLYSALVEGGVYTKDPDLIQMSMDHLGFDMTQVNEQASITRFGESPTMSVA